MRPRESQSFDEIHCIMRDVQILWGFVLTDYVSLSEISISSNLLSPPADCQNHFTFLLQNYAIAACSTKKIKNLENIKFVDELMFDNSKEFFAIQMMLMQDICRFYDIDPSEPEIMTVGMASLLGNSGFKIVDKALSRFGKNGEFGRFQNPPPSVYFEISQSVCFLLIKKLRARRIINYLRRFPFLEYFVVSQMTILETYEVGKTFNKILKEMQKTHKIALRSLYKPSD